VIARRSIFLKAEIEQQDIGMYPIDFLWRSAQRFPGNLAVVSDRKTLTYRELAHEVLRQAVRITAIDSTVGSMICLGASNSVEHLVTLLAILAAGKVWVPMNPRNGDPELLRALEFVKPVAVFADDDMTRRLAGGGVEIYPLVDDQSATAQEDMVPMGPMSSLEVSLEATQAIKFTGGTTGIPKGVQQPLRAWNTNIVTQVHEFGLTKNDRYLVAAPLTHGTSTYMLPLIAAGGALVFPEASSPAAYLDAAQKYNASIVFAPPTLITALAEEQIRNPRNLATMRYLIYGGAPMAADRIVEVRGVFGPIICTTYGQTEAPQIVTILKPGECRGEMLRSVGRASMMTKIAILSRDGLVLGSGVEGEIAVRGDLVMSGYYQAPEETKKVLVNGWLRTGDVGVIDDQGNLFLRDRIRDVIITGGFNVYPSDVEAVLSRHPGIADCMVVGIPNAKWGEAVHAAVQLKLNQPVDKDELIAMVKAELGSVKAPKSIHIFDELPRSAVGKPLKTMIKTEIQRRQETE
jgi:fatty-acyl-CoA synthase